MNLNEKCKECGKNQKEAESVIPVTQSGILTGEWLCEECYQE